MVEMEGTSTEEILRLLSERSGGKKTGYRVNLFCNTVSSYGECTDGGCTVKRVGPIRMSRKLPTESDCLRVLGEKIRQFVSDLQIVVYY
jgi:hypothetical protein